MMRSRAASTCALCPVITIISLSLPSDGNSILVSVSSRICKENSTKRSVKENMVYINTNIVRVCALKTDIGTKAKGHFSIIT